MLPSSHSTNLYDKMLTDCSIITASNDSVISCDNIQFNHSFLSNVFYQLPKKFWTRKLKEYYPRQSADSKNTVDLCLQVDAFADHTSVYTVLVPTLQSLDCRLLVSK